MREYTLNLNSSNGTQIGGNNNQIRYNFDWSQMEEGEYLVEVSVMAGTMVDGTAPTYWTKLPMFYTDWGGDCNQYMPTSTTNDAVKSSSIFISHLSALRFQHHASKKDNQVLRMKRPTNNTFTIRCLDNEGNLWVAPAGAVYPPNLQYYSLTFTFQKVD